MALIKQCYVSISIFLAIFLCEAVDLTYSDGSYYRYDTPLGDSDMILHNTGAEFYGLQVMSRERRYLAGDFPAQQFQLRDDEAHLSDMEESHSHSDSEHEVKTTSSTESTSSATNASQQIPQDVEGLNNTFPANFSEAKTGGNYVPIKPDNATHNSSITSITDSNRTSQSRNSTDSDVVVSTPANQIPVTPVNNTNLTLTNIPLVNETGVTSPIENSTSKNNTSDIEDDIMITKFPEDLSNKTLAEHHINKTAEDHHLYYNSSFVSNNEQVGNNYWVNMTNRSNVLVNKMLSQSHRRAATVRLSFDFPFYGHIVRNVTIATGGFLYTGDYVHSWLAATQYIAPLMANFDTSLSPESFVKYVDNGTAFTVQWDKVKLQDKPSSGDFTFQATLLKTGDIVFVYQNVPVVIDNITDDQHPVKVGLSDAYIIDRTIFFVRRKTIYEYHRVNFDRQQIRNWTVIYLYALPTCLDGNDCESCLTHITGFNCKWCDKAKRCSNGMDRHRQEWLQDDCDNEFVMHVNQCPNTFSRAADTHDSPTQASSVGQGVPIAVEGTPGIKTKGADHSGSVTVSGVIGIMLLLVLVLVSALWVLYAYRNPHTASGQFLIRYRPSQWSWKRGEARYTAATIHM